MLYTQHASNLQVARVFGVVPEQRKHIYSKYVHHSPVLFSFFISFFLEKENDNPAFSLHIFFEFQFNLRCTPCHWRTVILAPIFAPETVGNWFVACLLVNFVQCTANARLSRGCNREDRLVHSKYFNYITIIEFAAIINRCSSEQLDYRSFRFQIISLGCCGFPTNLVPRLFTRSAISRAKVHDVTRLKWNKQLLPIALTSANNVDYLPKET